MSNRKIYRVKLSSDEREELELVSKGERGHLKIAAWKVQRVKGMLLCDEGEWGPACAYEDVAGAFSTTTRSARELAEASRSQWSTITSQAAKRSK